MRGLLKSLPLVMLATPACDDVNDDIGMTTGIEIEVSGPIVRYDLPWDVAYTVDFSDDAGAPFRTVQLDERFRYSPDTHGWIEPCLTGAVQVVAQPDIAPVDDSPELLYPSSVSMNLECPGRNIDVYAGATIVPTRVEALSGAHRQLAFGTFACDVTTTCDGQVAVGVSCRDSATARDTGPLVVGLSDTRIVCDDGTTAAFAPFGRSTAGKSQLHGFGDATHDAADWSIVADRAMEGCHIEALVTVAPLDAAGLGHTPACTAWPSFRVTAPAGTSTCGTTGITAEWSELQGFAPEQFLSVAGQGLRSGAPARDERCVGGKADGTFADTASPTGYIMVTLRSWLPGM